MKEILTSKQTYLVVGTFLFAALSFILPTTTGYVSIAIGAILAGMSAVNHTNTVAGAKIEGVKDYIASGVNQHVKGMAQSD